MGRDARKVCLLLAVCLLAPAFCGCRSIRGQEPEQGALVTAVGVDRDASGVRLTLETLIPLEGKGVEVRVLRAAGGSAGEAFAALTAGFPRALLFGHCAVLVLGDGLRAEELDVLLSAEALPPEMQAVTAPQADALLSLGGLSTPAVGYDLQAILAGTPGTRCRVYELLSGGMGAVLPEALPRFVPAAEGSGRLVDLQMPHDVSQETEKKGD